MALLSLWSSNPETVLSLSIEQVVSTAGDGKLRDGSECSAELRTFLSQVPSSKLTEFADDCLAAGFPKSGLVLQDIVNELGKRLDYGVTSGRYQGTPNSIGYDGLWKSPEGHDILVEIKTTDAYRISLQTVATYRDKLLETNGIAATNSMLMVVGREDTGELEAQVRGSRYAWDMRLISVDSLLHLVRLKESTEASSTGSKIRSVLIPKEYTRLDSLIDVIFTAAKDVEYSVDTEQQSTSDDSLNGGFTDSTLLQEKRDQIVEAFGRKYGTRLIRKSRALYWSATHTVRVACTVSKRYTRRGSVPYWYAYHPQWDKFLGEAETGHFILGCMDLDRAFAIPVSVLRSYLDNLNTTNRTEGTAYWHIKIIDLQPQEYALQLSKTGGYLPLAEFAFPL